MVDWISLFESHQIPYATKGPNVSRGHISIHCPFCGSADPSMHLSVALSGQGWRCWRQSDHAGRSAPKLIRALLGCSWDQAIALAGGSAVAISDDLLATVNRLFEGPSMKSHLKTLVLPDEFRPFREKDSALAAPYANHLVRRRQYEGDMLPWLTEIYGLMWCRSGPFGGRIIFPVYSDGHLVSWTGRTIGRSELRYKTLGCDPELDDPCALGPISNYLLWYDCLLTAKPHTLVLVEGPFDALRINVLGRKYGVYSTCFFTAAPGASQIDLIHHIAPKFQRLCLLLDQGTLTTAMRLQGALSSLGAEVLWLPQRYKDPGELDQKGFADLFLFA